MLQQEQSARFKQKLTMTGKYIHFNVAAFKWLNKLIHIDQPSRCLFEPVTLRMWAPNSSRFMWKGSKPVLKWIETKEEEKKEEEVHVNRHDSPSLCIMCDGLSLRFTSNCTSLYTRLWTSHDISEMENLTWGSLPVPLLHTPSLISPPSP